MKPLEVEVSKSEDSDGLSLTLNGLESVHDVRKILGHLDDASVELAENIGDSLQRIRSQLGESAVGLTFNTSKMALVIGGTEYGPYSNKEAQEIQELMDSYAEKLNVLLNRYFGISIYDRYMGSYPYPDVVDGSCQLREVIALSDIAIRDRAIDLFNEAIIKAELKDTKVNSRDENDRSWQYAFELVVSGDAVNSNLVATRKMKELIDAFETELEERFNKDTLLMLMYLD